MAEDAIATGAGRRTPLLCAASARHPDPDRYHWPDGWRNMTLPDRIRARVRVDENDCWIWPGARSEWDHGMVGNKPGLRPTAVGVHRVMWEEANGPDPDGMVVAHLCGVRLCCNPEHLVLGRRHGRARAVVVASDPP